MTIAARQTLEPNEADGRPQFLPIAAAFEWETAMLDAVAGGAGLQVMVWRCERCIVVARRLAAGAAGPGGGRGMVRRGV
jgi:hypothetical protein